MEVKIERKKVKFNIKRYDPNNQQSKFESYEIDVPKGMTILEALQFIKDNMEKKIS